MEEESDSVMDIPCVREFIEGYRCEKFVPPNETIKLTQHNLVLVVDYGDTKYILPILCRKNPEFKRSIKTFPCVQICLVNPKVTQMFFFSGSSVFVGGRFQPATIYVALLYRLILEKLRQRYTPEFPAEKLIFGKPYNANLVFTGKLPHPAYDIGKFAARVNDINYDPEEFPGANTKIRDSYGRAVAQVMAFEFGFINVMGCESRSDALYAAASFARLIEPYACTPKYSNEDIIFARQKELWLATQEVADEMNRTEKSVYGANLNRMISDVPGGPSLDTIQQLVEQGEEFIVD